MHIKQKLILILILVCSKAHALDLSLIGSESKNEAIFEAIKRDEYLAPNFTYESSISNLANKKQCIRINHNLHKGGRQRSDNPFKWVIDVPVGVGDPLKTKEDIAGLEALVSAGLLEKERVSIEDDSGLKSFDRYRLTVKGWSASTERKKLKSCFYFGRAKYLSLIDVKKIEIPIGYGEKENAYEVLVKVGFPKDYKLPDWAMNREIRAAFPSIDKLVSGYEKKVIMNNSSGEWREYLSARQISRMTKSGAGRSERYFNRTPPTTKKETMLESFKFEEHRHHMWSCISLPGDSSNGAVVDKRIGRYAEYSVAIYDNKERSIWDDAETIAKPNLERLVAAGVLVSSRETGIEGEGSDAGKTFNGTVYKLSPQYQHIFDPKRNCIFLGKGKVNIVSLEIVAGNTSENPFINERIKYKYIMTFPNPPKWANDQVLQAWWSDLKGALKYGLACEGKFAIDLSEERKMGGGSGGCWWAYNSVGEL